MWFAQVSTDQVVEGFGLPAAIVIITLAAVAVYLFRENKKERDKYDALQEKRVQENRDTISKLEHPVNDLVELYKQGNVATEHINTALKQISDDISKRGA